METTCTIENCDRKHWSRGLCRNHYAAWRRAGQKEVLREARQREVRICEQCDGPIPPERRANVMFCSPQCKRRAQYDKQKANPEPKQNPPCSVDGCETPYMAKGLCSKHYNRLRDKGSLDDARQNQRGTCATEGCDRLTVGRGLCDPHYRAVLATRKREQLRERRANRACMQCSGSMEGRQGDAMFCSRACKSAERIASGRAAESSRRHYYASRYGMSREEAVERFGAQCNICGTTDGGGRHGNLHVDHDHKTGAVRGALCHGCNVSLGHFRDDPALLRKAAEYLESANLSYLET